METARSLPSLTGHLSGLSRQRLWLQILLAMILGIGFGVLIGPTTGLIEARTALLVGNWVALPGRLFLLAIQFVVVPLVVASVIRGIAAGEGSEKLGQLGLWTVAFFILTTLAAVVLGLLVASIIEPGRFIDGGLINEALKENVSGSAEVVIENAKAPPRPEEVPELIISLFPRDPLTTFVSGNMLQIVMAAAIIGVAMVMTPFDQRRPLLELLASVQAACMVIVGWVLKFAPVAVFGLLAHITARVGLSTLIGTAVYMLTVIVGLALLFLIYLIVAKVVAGRSWLGFLRETREVLLLAFSTSSSAAVMPVTLTTTEQHLRVRSQVARFVIPLGTTINMGGTALYQGVAALFLAQVFGVELGLAGMVLIVVMATGAAIGSPGTPGVGIVILASILNSVGIPPGGIAIILGVDRLLDMCRTVVNVMGDMVACVTIDHLLKAPVELEAEHLDKVPTPAMGDAAAGPKHAQLPRDLTRNDTP